MSLIDRRKSLEELENQVWPYNDFGSYVVKESQRLRKVPVGDLSVEHLRLLIGQEIGLSYLVPLAIERLEEDPLIGGAYYRGDLLSIILRLPKKFWSDHPLLNNQIVEIGSNVSVIYDTIREELLPALQKLQYRNGYQ